MLEAASTFRIRSKLSKVINQDHASHETFKRMSHSPLVDGIYTKV
jgi:hypothetical protein